MEEKYTVAWEGKTPRHYSTNVALRYYPDMDQIITVMVYLIDEKNHRVVLKEQLDIEKSVTEEEAAQLAINWMNKVITEKRSDSGRFFFST